jgi:hypothetical protein
VGLEIVEKGWSTEQQSMHREIALRERAPLPLLLACRPMFASQFCFSDKEVYSDPDRLDIMRRDVRPMSFGGGIHYCVGAQLARIQAEIAIATLLRRLPNLQLDDIEHPDWRQTFVLRGLNNLPASW